MRLLALLPLFSPLVAAGIFGSWVRTTDTTSSYTAHATQCPLHRIYPPLNHRAPSQTPVPTSQA